MTSSFSAGEKNARIVSPVIVSDNKYVKISGGQSAAIGARLFWMDGGVVVNGQAVWSSSDLLTLDSAVKFRLSAGSYEEIANWWMQEARGVGALYVYDENEAWAICVPDPLGGALAFFSKTETGGYVSTDLRSLRETAGLYGDTFGKSALFQAERIAFNNGGLVHTSFEGVARPDPFEYLLVRPGQIEVQMSNALNYFASLSLRDLFEAARSHILESSRAVADAKSTNKTSHLSGGFDSRLVLAGLRNIGADSNFNYFCSGPVNGPDQTVFRSLAKSLSLVKASGNPITPALALQGVDQLVAPLFNSSGLTGFCPAGNEGYVDSIVLGGGYGGVLRTVYGDREISLDGETVDPGVASESFLLSQKPYLTPYARGYFVESLTSRLNQLTDLYDLDFAADAFYTYGRSRYHFGQGAVRRNKVAKYIDPLYSPAAFFLSSKVRQRYRRVNVAGYDLMDSLSSDLLGMPFDSEKFGDLLTTLRKPAVEMQRLDDASISSVEVPRPSSVGRSAAHDALVRASEYWGEDFLSWSYENERDARRYGVSVGRVRHLRAMRKLLGYSINVLRDNDDLRNVFDFSYLRDLVRNYRPQKRFLRELNAAGPALFWLASSDR